VIDQALAHSKSKFLFYMLHILGPEITYSGRISFLFSKKKKNKNRKMKTYEFGASLE